MEVVQVLERRTRLEADIRRLLENFRSSTGVVPFVEVEWPQLRRLDSSITALAPPTVTVSLRL